MRTPDSNIGQYDVFKLQDGLVPMDGAVFPQSLSEEGERIRLLNGFDADGVALSPANAFLLRPTLGKHILVDAGCGCQFGPSFGKVPHLLEEMGVGHDKINAIIFTHLHPDHLGGVIDDDGQVRFKNATLYTSKREVSFWCNLASRKDFPELQEKGYFDQVEKLLAPYLALDQVQACEPGDKIFEGISLKSLPGHTPGHCGVLIESRNEKGLIWGDTVHSQAYQFVHPDWSAAFDMYKEQALETRLNMFKELENSDVVAFGPHVYGHGYLRRKKNNEYHFVSREKSSAV